MGYFQLGVIFGLLTKKSNVKNLLIDYSTTLIWVAKSGDKKVIGIKKLEQWQRLKIYKMRLMQYLKERKMELLYREIKLSTKIWLKTTLQ